MTKAISNLKVLLKSIKPELVKGKYVFCTVSEDSKLNPIMMFKEKQGITLILRKKKADKNNLSYSSVWSMITLTVHSDLEAVGFLDTITTKLAENKISVNVVSAYYHDYLFVPFEKGKKVMGLLKEI